MCTVRSWWMLPLHCRSRCAADTTHWHYTSEHSGIKYEKKYIKFLCISLSVILLWASIQNQLKLFTLCATRIKCEWKGRRRLRTATNRHEFEWLLCAFNERKELKRGRYNFCFMVWDQMLPLPFFRRFVKLLHTLIKYIFFNSRFNWHPWCDGKSEI